MKARSILVAPANVGACVAVAAVTILVMLLALVLTPPARAGEGNDTFPVPTMSDAAWAELEQAARANGSVPVIVALAVTAKQDLGPGEEAAQSASIAQARASVLGELRRPGRAALKTSDTMPLFTMQATAADISKLRRSKRVAAVTEDHEIVLDGSFAAGEQDGGSGGTPDESRPDAQAGGGTPTGTTSNGDANQLPAWWDWYRIGVDTARGWGHTGSGQLIAVLDTGVDRNHPWLTNKVVNEACFAQRTLGQNGGDCPNGGSSQLGYGAAAPCTYSYTCAHGTHVAHTAAGTWGVASGASIMAVQVLHKGANGEPTYWESDVVWGLKHVYDNRAYYRIAAVNMSIGGTMANGLLYGGYCDNGPASDSSANATYIAGWINSLKNVGIATTVSSGNDDSSTGLRRPACIKNAISVGNTTQDTAGYDAIFGYVAGRGSNSNSTLDLVAPGTDICSAVPVFLDNDGNADGVDCRWIGTSMAAPHVAGAIAVARAYKPSLAAKAATVTLIENALKSSGTSVTDSRNNVTRTRIHVANLLYYL